MKRICFLAVLLMVMAPVYAFSAEPPNLIGHWEGTGKFMVRSYPSEEVDVTVTLDITEQFGTKFKGLLNARYLDTNLVDYQYVGGMIDIGVGGHIQGGNLPAVQSRTINMFGGWQMPYGETQAVIEIDGQYTPAHRGIWRLERRAALNCRLRGMALWSPTDSINRNGVPEVGDFTLHKVELTPVD